MPVSETNFGEFLGVKNLYCAKITTDSSSTWTPQTIKRLAPVASIAIEPNVSTKTRYYDNVAYYTTTTEGETKLTLVVAGIDTETKAAILGYNYNSSGTNGKRLWNNGEVYSGYYALGFEADVEGGKKFYWFLKGKFEPYKEEFETKTTDINEKTTTLTYTAITTTHKWNFGTSAAHNDLPVKYVEADNRIDTAVTTATWFNQYPIVPTEP